MTITISSLRRVNNNKNKLPRLRFTMTTENEIEGRILTETRDGCLAGVGKDGPWVQPPYTNYKNYKWSVELQEVVIKILEGRGLLKDLEGAFEPLPVVEEDLVWTS